MKTGLTCYYPEMNEAKPEAQIEARLSHYGRHWYLKTVLALNGRGVKFTGTHTDLKGYTWNQYKVTDLAFKTICEKYAVSSESLL